MIQAAAGQTGVRFAYLIQKHTSDVELRIIKNLFENSKFLSESYHFTGKYSQNRLIVPLEWQKMTVSLLKQALKGVRETISQVEVQSSFFRTMACIIVLLWGRYLLASGGGFNWQLLAEVFYRRTPL